MPSNHKLPLLITCAAMLLGAGLRLNHIVERTMSHIEMYVPNIPMGVDLSVPKSRMDLVTVVTNTLSADTHPPGYYVFMWFVTKCFGTGTLAMRLPSVFFGVASIGLLYWVGLLIGQPVAGCIAAVFLALNGYLMIWSGTARMYPMVGFIGLLTSVVLLLLIRSDRHRRLLGIAYAAFTILGLCTHVFFWALLATQILWVLANALAESHPLPRILNIQMLVVVLASPLLAFAVYQSVNQVAFVSSVPVMLREYLQFMYVIPGWDDTWAPGGTPALALAPQFFIPRVVLFLLCMVLLVEGVRQLKPAKEPIASEPAGSLAAAWWSAAVLGALIILAHTIIAEHHMDNKPTLKYSRAMIVLPLLLALGATVIRKSWDRFRVWPVWRHLRFLQGAPPLIWMAALGPFALLAIVSFLFHPLTDPRRLMFLAPYLLLTLALGAVKLAQRSRFLAVCLFMALAALHGFSVYAYSNRTVTPIDFAEFAGKLRPRVQTSDLVFLRRGWDITPILYYFRPAQYHVAANHFEDICRANPGARVWVLLFHREKVPDDIQPALADYREVEAIDSYEARAVLYCRGACSLTGESAPAGNSR